MLGVLAYQNRDKLCELIPGAGYLNPNDPQRRILAQITNGVSRADLGEILERFREVGAGSKVDSWVGSGPNQLIEPREVEAAMDEGTLRSMSMQTRLSREELIRRIARDLPETVNEMTPNGEWPPEPTQAWISRPCSRMYPRPPSPASPGRRDKRWPSDRRVPPR
ncbi:YidB family protein [Mesorhizobium sp. M0643]